MQKWKRGAWVTHQVYIFFAALDWFQAVLDSCIAREKSLCDKSQFPDIWISFFFSSVLQRFLESDHLMVIRQKIFSTKAFESGTLRTNETILNMLIKLAFPRFWKTATYFSLLLLTGGFCGILSGFLHFLPLAQNSSQSWSILTVILRATTAWAHEECTFS